MQRNDFICKFEAGKYLTKTELLYSLRDSYLKPSAATVQCVQSDEGV
jgi:hypothetical protein